MTLKHYSKCWDRTSINSLMAAYMHEELIFVEILREPSPGTIEKYMISCTKIKIFIHMVEIRKWRIQINMNEPNLISASCSVSL